MTLINNFKPQHLKNSLKIKLKVEPKSFENGATDTKNSLFNAKFPPQNII